MLTLVAVLAYALNGEAVAQDDPVDIDNGDGGPAVVEPGGDVPPGEEPAEPAADEPEPIDEELLQELSTREAVEASANAVIAALRAGDDEALEQWTDRERFDANVVAQPASGLSVSVERFRQRYYSAGELWGEYMQALDLSPSPEEDLDGEEVWVRDTRQGPRGFARMLADDGIGDLFYITFVFAIDPAARAWRLVAYEDPAYEPWGLDPLEPDPLDPEQPDEPDQPDMADDVEPVLPIVPEISEQARRRRAVVFLPEVPQEFEELIGAEQQRTYAEAVLDDLRAFEEFEDVSIVSVPVYDIDEFLRAAQAAAFAGDESFDFHGTEVTAAQARAAMLAGYAFAIALEQPVLTRDQEEYEAQIEVIQVTTNLAELPEGFDDISPALRAKLSFDAEAGTLTFRSSEPMDKDESDELVEVSDELGWQVAVSDLSFESEEVEPTLETTTRLGTFQRVSFQVVVSLLRIDEQGGVLLVTPVEGGRFMFDAQGRQERDEYLLIEGTEAYAAYVAEFGAEATMAEAVRLELAGAEQAMAEASRTLPSGITSVLRGLVEFQPEPDVPDPVIRTEGVQEVADGGRTFIAAMRTTPPLDAFVGLVDAAGVHRAVGKVRAVGADVPFREAPAGMTMVEIQRFSGQGEVNFGVQEYAIVGFQFDVSVGLDLAMGHDRSIVFPTIPDPALKQITDASGNGLVSLYLGYDFGRLIGAPALSEFWVGFDAKLGFGGFYRYSSLGGSLAKKFYFDAGGVMLGLNLGVSLGVLRHSAGGQDVTDVLFFILTNNKGVPPDQAADETHGQRINSDWLFYASFAPSLSVWLMPELEITFGLGLLFAGTSEEFELGDRRFNADDPDLQVPGFQWRGIGFQMFLGATAYF